MPCKHPAPAGGSIGTPAKVRKVPTMVKKVELLEKLKSGMSYAVCDCHYSRNESSIRYIKRKKKEIHKCIALEATSVANKTLHLRDPVMIKMKKALSIWIENMNSCNVSVDSNYQGQS
ncbi:putative Tigger transposable element-derived protein 1-like 283 [Homarus americanus]|uniref:Putative Tigger transposable element-derived protein 1-like 283 n=1 Tax=Homarus americanus TaxID=6706 RepID=A0A8J5TIJ0_HOMAM|nr:putative Tigger transposable element-derived protein 1-like 283 [Homarus americanus]